MKKVHKELKNLSIEELNQRAEEIKKELLKLNVQANSGANTAGSGKLRLNKKNIARIQTLLKQKEEQ